MLAEIELLRRYALRRNLPRVPAIFDVCCRQSENSVDDGRKAGGLSPVADLHRSKAACADPQAPGSVLQHQCGTRLIVCRHAANPETAAAIVDMKATHNLIDGGLRQRPRASRGRLENLQVREFRNMKLDAG